MLSLFTVFALTDVPVPTVDVGFKIPQFDAILTFFIRFVVIIAGLAALLYLILGAISWITSGGDKERVNKAQEKITQAVIGIVILFTALAVVVLIEKIFFPKGSGLGITEPIKLPKLIEKEAPTNQQ